MMFAPDRRGTARPRDRLIASPSALPTQTATVKRSEKPTHQLSRTSPWTCRSSPPPRTAAQCRVDTEGHRTRIVSAIMSVAIQAAAGVITG